TATTCTVNMIGTAIVVVNPLPLAYTVTGGGSYCAGGTGVMVGLSGSNTGIHYQLYRGITSVGTPVTGTGSALNLGLQTVAGSYTVIATDATSGCTNNMTGSVAVTITATVTPTVTITTSPGDTVCAGTTVTFTAIPVNGGTAPTYVWNVNGSWTGSGSTYIYMPSDGDIVTVHMTSS